ncbi:putative quinol monooxygenase [Haloglomus litoreum]|uniref:putative quinol monooxygenase n=1 Tax=Haloglomus litoreum TaxID=3034026 RepID=UPI0023E75B21|nr:putative quinol monooxygenase [Haloglomus sp. DT116]
MIVLNASIPIDPDSRETAVEAATELAQHSREEAGVIDYRVALDVEDDTTLRIFEQYEDEDALNAHMNSDHYGSFESRVPGFAAGAPELHRFDVSEKTQLM